MGVEPTNSPGSRPGRFSSLRTRPEFRSEWPVQVSHLAVGAYETPLSSGPPAMYHRVMCAFLSDLLRVLLLVALISACLFLPPFAFSWTGPLGCAVSCLAVAGGYHRLRHRGGGFGPMWLEIVDIGIFGNAGIWLLISAVGMVVQLFRLVFV